MKRGEKDRGRKNIIQERGQEKKTKGKGRKMIEKED